MTIHNKYIVLFLTAIIFPTIIIYIPALNGVFLNWDDTILVTENPLIKTNLRNLANELFSNNLLSRHNPISLLSFFFDYKINALDPFIFHLHNLALHITNTILVFFLVYALIPLKKQSLNIALITTFLFGVASLNVEAVAWISERNHLLFTMYFIISLIFYITYCQSIKSLNQRNTYIYLFFSILAFALSILSKQIAITLFFTLFAIDFYYDRKLISKRVLIEKLPFLIMALAIIILTLTMREAKYGESISEYTLSIKQKIYFGAYSYFQYFILPIVPHKLSAAHLYPDNFTISSSKFISSIIFIIILIYTHIRALNRNKLYALGLYIFSINILLPLPSFRPLYNSFLISERYAYLPSIGIFLILSLLYYKLIKTRRKLQIFISFVFIIHLSFICFNSYIAGKTWKNTRSLFSNVLEKDKNSHIAYFKLGEEDIKEKRYEEAITKLDKGISLYPNYSIAYNNRAYAKQQCNKYEEAINDYHMAIIIDSSNIHAYLNRGILYKEHNEINRALSDFKTAIKKDTNNLLCHYHIGLTYFILKDYNNTIIHFNKASNLSPNNIEILINRGNAFAINQQYEQAINDFNKVLNMDSTNAEVYLKRGVIYVKSNKIQHAISNFSEAIKYFDNPGQAHFFRANAYLANKDTVNACNDWKASVSLGFQGGDNILKTICQ